MTITAESLGLPETASIDRVTAAVQWSASYDAAGQLLNGLGGDPKWNDVQRPDYNNLVGQGSDPTYGQVYGVVALDPTNVADIVAVLQSGATIHAIGLETVKVGWNFSSPVFLDLAFYQTGHLGVPMEDIGPIDSVLLDIRRPVGHGTGISPILETQPDIDILTGLPAADVGAVLATTPWDACGLASDSFVSGDRISEYGAIDKPTPGVSRLAVVYESV